MNKENQVKISKASIFFYACAVIFLLVAMFYMFVTYQSIVEYKQQAEPTLQAMFSAYFGNAAPFFAYAIGCYGIGLVITKVTALTAALTLCVDDAQDEDNDEEDENNEDDEESEYISEEVKSETA